MSATKFVKIYQFFGISCLQNFITCRHTESQTDRFNLILQVMWLASPRSEAQAHVCFGYVAPPGECYYNAIMLRLVFIIERGTGIARFLCAMCVFEVRASSSSPRLPLFQISFLSRPAELAHGGKSCTQSLNHSVTHPAYLMPRERSACTSKNCRCWPSDWSEPCMLSKYITMLQCAQNAAGSV